jgi:protein kinase X
LIKRLLQEDLSKRIGNLKNGVNDIKNHKFFKDLNWDDVLKGKYKAPYIPPLK